MKKLLILAGVIAFTSTVQVFAQEDVLVEGPCPVRQEFKKHDVGYRHARFNHRFDKKKFVEALELTDEQKAQAKQLREEEFAAIKPLMEKMKEKNKEIASIMNEKLTAAERQEKLEPIRKEMHAIKGEIRLIHLQGKKDFESILTDKQLKKLKNMKAAAKKDFAKMKKNHRVSHPRLHPTPYAERKIVE